MFTGSVVIGLVLEAVVIILGVLAINRECGNLGRSENGLKLAEKNGMKG